MCKEGFGGERCDQCLPGFYDFPNCFACECQRSILVPLNLLKNLMYFTFLCLNKSKISQKSQNGLAEMSSIAKSGNSMLIICFDLNKTDLPDLAIKRIPTCPI